ncbi:hypothetical protein BJX63DRAFT_406690 [Aspergillus granulosus]|uniref:Uncharacterized protein n=1 Tax=Aspergillus granulosus TaxID=176169 RepID=A0ABR4H114_9EURO
MFIPYKGPSEKDPGVRGAINAVVAANASLKRQRRQEASNRTNSKDTAVDLRWLHDRPLVIIESQKQVTAGDKLITNTENPEETLEAFYGESYLWDGSIKWYLGDGVRYPTPKQPYYPALMFQRQNLFLLVAHQYPSTFAHNIYSSWTQTVLSDPCLFHATLFATSSLMDVMQNKQDNPVTLRHKGETIRLVKKAVTNANTNGLRHEIIAVTTYLVYFARLLGNFEEASKHDVGITAMIQFKGADSLPEDTYTSYLLRLRDVWNSIVSHAETLFPFVTGPRPSFGQYTSLLAMAIQKQLERAPEMTLPVPIVNFLYAFNAQCVRVVDYQWPDYTLPAPPETPDDAEIQHAMQCVYIAATIYWTAVTRCFHGYKYSKTHNIENTQKLKVAILQSDNLFWLRFGPEVLRWILMTGATAAASLSDQAWFIMRSYMITSIIEPREMGAFLVGVDHLLWVFNYQA